MGTTYPFDECSYNDEWDVVDAYNSSVTFVHLVGPEPHPSQPDTNFDSGKMPETRAVSASRESREA